MGKGGRAGCDTIWLGIRFGDEPRNKGNVFLYDYRLVIGDRGMVEWVDEGLWGQGNG